MKIVINKCFGGFGLSDTAYEWLIEHGVKCKKYIEQKKNPKTGLYLPEPKNDGFVIFDRTLDPPSKQNEMHIRCMGRYWTGCYDSELRAIPLVVQCVEELGEKADGQYAKLAIVDIPDDVDWEIDEYDGQETIREKSRSWG